VKSSDVTSSELNGNSSQKSVIFIDVEYSEKKIRIFGMGEK
jgi:hypothetical protein